MNLALYFLSTFHLRLERVLFFFFSPKNYQHPFWILEWPLFLLDLIALPEILQLLFRLVFLRQRRLYAYELEIGKSIFSDSINWNLLRINTRSYIAKRWKIAFVSFHTIHSFGDLTYDLLIHELVHVWQYQKFGSPYIIRSLYAQRTAEAYEYGGIEQLAKCDNLLDFNFEQMAEIIRHAYLDMGQNTVYNKYCMQLLE